MWFWIQKVFLNKSVRWTIQWLTQKAGGNIWYHIIPHFIVGEKKYAEKSSMSEYTLLIKE